MRIILAASTLALAAAAMAGQVQAKHAEAQKAGESVTTSSCSAYQQSPDGSWTRLPCKESGERGQPQTQHRPASQGGESEAR